MESCEDDVYSFTLHLRSQALVDTNKFHCERHYFRLCVCVFSTFNWAIVCILQIISYLHSHLIRKRQWSSFYLHARPFERIKNSLKWSFFLFRSLPWMRKLNKVCIKIHEQAHVCSLLLKTAVRCDQTKRERESKKTL